MWDSKLATADILCCLCHLDGTEPRVEQTEVPEKTPLSWETGKGAGKTSNPEKITCSKTPSLCSHHKEDSGGECRCAIHSTYRTTICRVWSKCVRLLQYVWHCFLVWERKVLAPFLIFSLFKVAACSKNKKHCKVCGPKTDIKNTICVHQMQQVHVQHTHSKARVLHRLVFFILLFISFPNHISYDVKQLTLTETVVSATNIVKACLWFWPPYTTRS